MAVTGSIAAAWEAGTTPATIPIMLEIINPKIIFPEVKTISKEPKFIKLAK